MRLRRFCTNGIPPNIFGDVGRGKKGQRAERQMAGLLEDAFYKYNNKRRLKERRIEIKRADYVRDQYDRIDYVVTITEGKDAQTYNVQFKTKPMTPEDKLSHLRVGIIPVDMPDYWTYNDALRIRIFMTIFNVYKRVLDSCRKRMCEVSIKDIEQAQQVIDNRIERHITENNEKLREKIPHGTVFNPA